MTKRDILVMHWLRPVAMTQLEAAYTLHRYDEAADKHAFLAEFGPRCVGIATNGHAPLTKGDLQHLPKVEIVACSSAGFEPIDVDALKERGIAFTNTSAALLDDVADTALMLTLAAPEAPRAGARLCGKWGVGAEGNVSASFHHARQEGGDRRSG